MKNITKTSFLLLLTKGKRTISFLCLLALLSVTAGLVGNSVFSRKAIDPVQIAIVDLEDSAETQMLFSTLMSSLEQDSLLKMIKTSQSEAARLLDNGEISASFLIPKDFIQSILRGENKPLVARYNPHTPLQSALIKNLLDQVLTILKASQSGIYAALDYTQEHAPEQYSAMYLAINARYINAALLHDQTIVTREIPSAGQINSFLFYLFSILLFLLTLGCCLFAPLINQTFSKPVLTQLLRRQHQREDSIVGGWILGWWGWFWLIGIFVFLAYSLFASVMTLPWHLFLFPALLLFLLYLSSLSVCIGFLIPNATHSTTFLSIYSVLSLFFSGGLIPLHYLPSSFTTTARFFPQYWALELVQSALQGNFSLPAVFVLLFFSLLFFAITTFYLKKSNQKVMV